MRNREIIESSGVLHVFDVKTRESLGRLGESIKFPPEQTAVRMADRFRFFQRKRHKNINP